MLQKNAKQLIVLEGNIGAGKSTLLKLIKAHLPVSIIPEPTDKWQKTDHEDNLLDMFYKETARWAYTFQSYAFLTRVQSTMAHMKANPDSNLFILERSVYCDRFCFAKNCYENGSMTQLEWNIYKDWFTWLVEYNQATRPDGFIYLRVDPEVSFQRAKKRNRSEETTLSKEYLQALHNKHEDWLIHQNEPCSSLKNIPVLTLDCNDEFENHEPRQTEHLAAIAQFMAQLEKKDNPATLKNVPQNAIHF
jgi:deoxyadenosine/deoxycytidine kinase